MTGTTHDPDDLAIRLASLGDALDLDDASPVDVLLERLERPSSRTWRRGWLVAAAIVTLVAGVVALLPDAREAVARWFGLEGLSIEVDPELSVPPVPTSFESPGPGESRIAVVDGREILVSAIPGTLQRALIEKTVGASDQVREVVVDGQPGLWISGAPHEVVYESPGGAIAVERAAANTLLWSDGAVLYRVEGFDELADAVSFAEGT
jgi:hypothetical protein